jgi:hypothetical protein
MSESTPMDAEPAFESTSTCIGRTAPMSPALRSNFFMAMALLLLLLVFLGFAPTLYLRPFFGSVDRATGSPQLPLHLLLHGLAMSSWYLLFAVQAGLVRYQRVSVHRQLGWAGAASACAVVVSGFVVLSSVVPRVVAGGAFPPEQVSRRVRAGEPGSAAGGARNSRWRCEQGQGVRRGIGQRPATEFDLGATPQARVCDRDRNLPRLRRPAARHCQHRGAGGDRSDTRAPRP